MGKYEVLLRRSVLKKDLHRIPKADVRRIMDTIRSLAHNPRLTRAKKLSGQERYRIRQGDYRIAFSIQDEANTVWVVRAGQGRAPAKRLSLKNPTRQSSRPRTRRG